ncbi:uncharacterized protein FPRO_10337 [Fusarium proliferatum ET1]|uniref:CCHC-type domain-containing protein n=1 Tax=Fusarium proliferatum (strain ET1) TaxID=1227346 RepID=A0A1L7VJM3_FUSPR|nr:uncharacterized protein FPRO_10337 [Fusarium proliferatum ET1]CZR40749.1 uncharacterized protein FPRO_10337 [Fusarium proliferatum ET1]
MAPSRQDEKQHNREGFEKRQAAKLKAKGGQSGSGRGTIGPDKSRDTGKYAQTMTDKHGITKGQKSQKSQTEEDDGRLILVPRGEVRSYGGIAEMVDLSGQRQDNMMLLDQTNGQESLYSVLDTTAQAGQALQTAQGVFGTSQMLTRFQPLRPNRLAEAKSKKIAYDILMSTDNARPRMPVSSRPLAERITFPQEEKTHRPQGESASTAGTSRRKLCANCGGDGHLVANCITAEDGSVRICIFCRTDSHLTDECEKFRRLSLTAKVKLLVVDRGNMPALATKKGWWLYLYDLLEADDSVSVPSLTSFPWAPKYAIDLFVGEKGRGIHVHQAEFDSTHDRSVLPENVNIGDLEDVYVYYWQTEFLVRPRRFDEIMRRSTGSHPEVEDSVCEWSDKAVSDDGQPEDTVCEWSEKAVSDDGTVVEMSGR